MANWLLIFRRWFAMIRSYIEIMKNAIDYFQIQFEMQILTIEECPGNIEIENRGVEIYRRQFEIKNITIEIIHSHIEILHITIE